MFSHDLRESQAKLCLRSWLQLFDGFPFSFGRILGGSLGGHYEDFERDRQVGQLVVEKQHHEGLNSDGVVIKSRRVHALS